jgi:hypothetical protein
LEAFTSGLGGGWMKEKKKKKNTEDKFLKPHIFFCRSSA